MSDRSTVRIKLFDTNDGTGEEYKILDKAMDEAGFQRTILSNDGIEYHLPPAEYNIVGDYDAEGIKQAASTAAFKAGRNTLF